MASTPKNICTHNTEQVITAKKTFTDGVVADKFELLDGTLLRPTGIETMEKNVANRLVIGAGAKKLSTTTDIILGKTSITVSKELQAPSFKGDASALTGLAAAHLEGELPIAQLPIDNRCFEVVEHKLSLVVDDQSPLCVTPRGLSLTFANAPAVSDARKFDHILVNSTKSGVGRLSVPSFMGHIASMNNEVLNIVNGGESLGAGISLYKGKVNKGRNQMLQFKTIVFDNNFMIEENDKEIRVSIKELELQETKDEQARVKREIADLGAQQKEARVMTIGALQQQITTTLEGMEHAEKTYKESLEGGKEELHQLLQALRQLVGEE